MASDHNRTAGTLEHKADGLADPASSSDARTRSQLNDSLWNRACESGMPDEWIPTLIGAQTLAQSSVRRDGAR